MKKYLGIILILLSFILTYIFWSLEQPEKTASIYRQYSQLLASIAMVAFAWISYIATRYRFIDNIFNGLDRAYVYHKYLSIVAIIFIWAHNLTVGMGKFSGGRQERPQSLPNGSMPPGGLPKDMESGILGFHISGKDLGSLSLYIFTALVIFFIISYKFEYEKWKFIHKLVLIPYAFGIVHYYLDSDYSVFSLSAYSLWMNLMNAIGIICAFYSIFMYEKTAFKYLYKISNIREVAKDTFEITGTSSGREMKYKPGQFAFIKIHGRNKAFPSHPFTMSQIQKVGEIQFTIKALGDHTENLKNSLSIGDVVALSGPHGKFDYRLGAKHQIWIAGGIGVTPFRSFWNSEIPSDYTIDFFYTYRNEEESAYIVELKVMEPKTNLKIHLIDSSKSGRLRVEDFEKYVNKDEHTDVFFCGPKEMGRNLEESLKKSKFKIRDFHQEHYKFR